MDIVAAAGEGQGWQRGTKEHCVPIKMSSIRMNPCYLENIVANYFIDKKMTYDTDESRNYYRTSEDVLHQSMLALLLGNITKRLKEGQCTHKLISIIDGWVKHRTGMTSRYTAQPLSAHDGLP